MNVLRKHWLFILLFLLPMAGGVAEEMPNARGAEERRKEVDCEHLRQLRKGLFEYQKIHGHFPDTLGQLAPEFVSADTLEAAKKLQDDQKPNLGDPEPVQGQPGYSYEFSNLVFRDGRTFAEIKEVQRTEWGDAVPILRAWGYEKLINMSYGGDLYETDLNWEWDPATLDVVKARGWGPGLPVGEFTDVLVLGVDGRPIPNAQVWANGRIYSFDLPNRPFSTNENGIAKIPLGTDLARTHLALRVEGNGLASRVFVLPQGQPPPIVEISAGPAQTVGGQVLDAGGKPVADTWIYLKEPANLNPMGVAMPGGSLGAVKTDAAGRWTASLHPTDVAAFNIAVGNGRTNSKYSAGEPVDPQAAAKRNAVSVSPAKPQ
jgi:hypothetical protein